MSLFNKSDSETESPVYSDVPQYHSLRSYESEYQSVHNLYGVFDFEDDDTPVAGATEEPLSPAARSTPFPNQFPTPRRPRPVATSTQVETQLDGTGTGINDEQPSTPIPITDLETQLDDITDLETQLDGINDEQLQEQHQVDADQLGERVTYCEQFPYANSSFFDSSQFLEQDEPPRKKKKNKAPKADKDVALIMRTRSSLMSNMRRPATLEEQLQEDILDVAASFESAGYLPHQSQLDLFKALITFLVYIINMSALHIKQFTVHEFVSGYTQYKKGVETVTLKVERQPGKQFSLFFKTIN